MAKRHRRFCSEDPENARYGTGGDLMLGWRGYLTCIIHEGGENVGLFLNFAGKLLVVA
jgi:hypothetical protein